MVRSQVRSVPHMWFLALFYGQVRFLTNPIWRDVFTITCFYGGLGLVTALYDHFKRFARCVSRDNDSVCRGYILVLGVIHLMMKNSVQDQCSRAVHLSLQSSRNQTGHWQTLITWDQEVLQDIEIDNRETAPMFLDMSQRVGGCSGHETFSIQTRLVMSSPRAGPGYITVPEVGRYKFHTTAVPWEAARMTCSNEGGHLAFIRSKAQEDALKEIFARHPKIEKTNWNEIAWLGFDDRHTEGEFITVLGESFHHIGYANWEAGKPDNKVWGGYTIDSDCGAMMRNGKIIDLPCSANYSFFCEQN